MGEVERHGLREPARASSHMEGLYAYGKDLGFCFAHNGKLSWKSMSSNRMHVAYLQRR